MAEAENSNSYSIHAGCLSSPNLGPKIQRTPESCWSLSTNGSPGMLVLTPEGIINRANQLLGKMQGQASKRQIMLLLLYHFLIWAATRSCHMHLGWVLPIK